MQKTNKPIYSAASYTRLSKDDFHRATDLESQPSLNHNESNSISNQKDLIRSFVEAQTDIKLINEYEDDGYTGLNFERPGF